MSEWLDVPDLDALSRSIDAWLAEMREDAPIESIERIDRRWFVRLRGDVRDFVAILLELGQRTLRYETYVMPAPTVNHAEVYECLLRLNGRLTGVHYALGDASTAEGGVVLRGSVADNALDRTELDRIIGSLYAEVERSFRALLKLGHGAP